MSLMLLRQDGEQAEGSIPEIYGTENWSKRKGWMESSMPVLAEAPVKRNWHWYKDDVGKADTDKPH